MVAMAGLAVTLLASACGNQVATGDAPSTAGASAPTTTSTNTASDTGVTEAEIKVAIHAMDLLPLVRGGFLRGVPENAATQNALRISYYLDKWNAEGGINGRKFTYELITWDPADPKTYQSSCQKVIDAKVFMVISPGGFLPDSMACITVNGQTQYVGVDTVSAKQFKEMDGNYISVSPPGAASAQAGIEALVKDAALLPKPARIAVLRTDAGYATEAFNEVEKVLDREGFNVVVSEAIKVANLPVDLPRSVEKVKAVGATHVISMLPLINLSQFATEATRAGLTLRYSMIEIGAGMCIAASAGQLPPQLTGAPCLTHWDNYRLDTAGTKTTDTPFEAQCRRDYEAIYAAPGALGKDLPAVTKTNPGVSWPGLKDATGKRLDPDQSYFECALMNIVKIGITGAGGNLTKETFQDALFRQKNFDVAGITGSKGSLAPNKPWLASNVQQVQVTPNPDGFRGGPIANGLYGGTCLSPLPCFRTIPNTAVPLTLALS